MTNSTLKKRTWAACSCPVCQFVFRVPKGEGVEGVICPACRYLLSMPDLKNQSAPNLGAVKSQGGRRVAVEQMPSPRVAREKKSQKRGGEKSLSWEEQKAPVASVGEVDSKKWIVLSCLFALCFVGGGVWLFLGGGNNDEVAPTPISKESVKVAEVQKVEPKTEIKAKSVDHSKVFEGEVLEEAKEVVRAFLLADQLSDFEGLVRNPEVVVPKMKKWYASHPLKAFKKEEVNILRTIPSKGPRAIMRVRLGDYSIKEIAIEKVEDKILVDWESWVGWGEMNWEDLFKIRPTKPVELRVIASRSNYYNREFNDDEKWVAVKLEYPNADRVIYAYIDTHQASKFLPLFRDLRSGQQLHVILKVRYPESSKADDQVIITEYVRNGWVDSFSE